MSVASACRSAEAQASAAQSKLVLTDGWYIQPSTDVTEKGSVLSTAAFQPKQRYRATMPSTVLADLQLESTSSDTPDWACRQGKPSVDVDGWNVVPASTAQH